MLVVVVPEAVVAVNSKATVPVLMVADYCHAMGAILSKHLCYCWAQCKV